MWPVTIGVVEHGWLKLGVKGQPASVGHLKTKPFEIATLHHCQYLCAASRVLARPLNGSGSGLCPPHRSASGNGQKAIVCAEALFSVTAARVWTRTDRSPDGWERASERVREDWESMGH